MARWSERQYHAVGHKIIRPGTGASERVTSVCLLVMSSFVSLLLLTGCPYYPPPAATVVMTPASFDRSFAAAAGAMHDEGLTITVQDAGSGTIVGGLAGSTVTATVRRQADGSVVVQFNSRDARDPALLERISSRYDRLMGR
jgi:hypothetical protein